jgi:hypothetical protein
MKKSTVVLIIVCTVCIITGIITAIAASVKATELGIRYASDNAEGCYEWFNDEGNWTWTSDETSVKTEDGDVNVNLPGIQVHVDDDKVNVNLPGIHVNVADGTAVVNESDVASETTAKAS